jgi:hypothetical protein
MAIATRVAGDEESTGNRDCSCNSNQVGGQRIGQWRGQKKVDGDCNEEGDGNLWRERGQWLWQRGWRAFDSGINGNGNGNGDGAKDTDACAMTGERGEV